MAELNQNQKSQQLGWPDSVWKVYFILEINHIQHNCLHVLYKIFFLKKIFPENYLAADEELI